MKKYGTLRRPAGIGCQPDDCIEIQDADKWKDGYWSIVVYDRELSEKEIYEYELIEL